MTNLSIADANFYFTTVVWTTPFAPVFPTGYVTGENLLYSCKNSLIVVTATVRMIVIVVQKFASFLNYLKTAFKKRD
jgi:hypothetical protein